MKRVILLLLIVHLYITAWTQNGTITGTITDAKTGEELIGATVLVAGSRNGTITDFDGKYSISLAPGTYNITVSYISYEGQQFNDVEVKSGEITYLNVNLGEAVQQLDEVKIVARSQQKTEMAMQVLQRKSASVLDGISAEQISKLGDSDAAEALKRITGVSVQDGKYVYVRGLSDRFLKITLNNAEIPGLDPNYNTVQMDLFPSNIIESMTITKNWLSDEPSFTSGLVNIKTKDFPVKFTLQASAKMEINTNTHFRNDFLTYEGGKKEWLAFDDGTRDIPSEVKGVEIPFPSTSTAGLVNEYSRSFNKTLATTTKSAPVNQSYSLSVGDHLNIGGNKSLGYIAAISYKNAYSFLDDGRLDSYDANTASTVSPNELLSEIYGSNNVIWSALLGANLKLSNNHKVGVIFLRTQNGESKARYFEGGTYYSDNFDMQKYSLEYLERSLSVYQVTGTHVFPLWNNAKIEWLSSYTSSSQNTPDLRFFITEVIENNEDTIYDVRSNRKPERRFRNMLETNWDSKIDMTFHVTNKFTIKPGGSYLQKVRDSDENRYTINQLTAITDYNGNPSNYVRDENFVTEESPYVGIYYANDFFENSRISYNAEDIIGGSYVMADLLFFDKFRMIVGGRVEYGSMFIENKLDTLAEGIRPSQKLLYEKGFTEDLDFLPTVSFKYEIIENMNLRFAFWKSITRPSFRERAPFTFYEYTEGTNIKGNPLLKRGLVDNFDFRWEYFFKPGEMISLSFFYKAIYDPIERYKEQTTTDLTTYRNGEDADLYGTELEFRKSLAFIGFLRDFQIGTNISLIYTTTPVDSNRLTLARQNVPNFHSTRPLYGQAPYIINAFLGYNNPNIGLSSNIGFNVEGPKIVIISKRQTPDVYEQPYPKLNFNISKELFRNYVIEFEVDNILNPVFKQNITLENGETYPFRQFTEGRSFSIAVKYAIK